jgi:RNA polymerase sigma factor (sigma-70 family)
MSIPRFADKPGDSDPASVSGPSRSAQICFASPYTLSGFPLPLGDEVEDVRVTSENEDALERFFEAESRRIWRALVAYTGDRDVASDAMSEAFAQALGRGDELRDPGHWVWRASFRIASGLMKARQRESPYSVEPSYELPESSREVVTLLGRLSPKQRAALILRYYAGYTSREIAQMLSSSTATVRVHLSQGRRRLRRLLEESDG